MLSCSAVHHYATHKMTDMAENTPGACQQLPNLLQYSDRGFVYGGGKDWIERIRTILPYYIDNDCTFPSAQSRTLVQSCLQNYSLNTTLDSTCQSLFLSRKMVDISSVESGEKPLDPFSLLIDVKNRFTKRILSTESIALENSTCGFKKFMISNKDIESHCWQKQIDPSYFATHESAEEYDFEMSPKASVEEDKFDCCSDLFAVIRCKRFLKGKECDGLCQKLHRLPKEDGVVCISKKLGQCYHSNKCIYLHEETFDDSDSDNEDDRLPLRETAVGFALQRLKNLRAPIYNEIDSDGLIQSPIQENPFKTADHFDPIDNFMDRSFDVDQSSDEMNSLAETEPPTVMAVSSEKDSSIPKLLSVNKCMATSNGVGINLEAVNPMERYKNNHTILSPCGSVKVSSPTSSSSKMADVFTSLKRELPSPAEQPVKKMKMEDSICVPRSDSKVFPLCTLNHESEDEILKEEMIEDMVQIPVKSEAPFRIDPLIERPCSESVEVLSKARNTLVCDKTLSLGYDYEIPSLDRLVNVGNHVLNIIDEMETIETSTTGSSETYGKLCEYLTDRGIEVLSEVNNSKLLVWDVHVRLFFNSILGIDNCEYLREVEKHLVTESFESYLKRVFTYFDT